MSHRYNNRSAEQPRSAWDARADYAVRQLVTNWEHWDALQRAEQVMYLLGYRISNRKLAKLIGRSESLIRHYEVIGMLPPEVKQGIAHSQFSARQAVASVRRYVRQLRSGRAQ